MGNILKSEFFRVRKSGITLGIAIFYAVTTLGWMIIYTVEKMNEKDIQDISDFLLDFGFRNFSSFPSGTLYYLILAFFVGGMVAGDYTTGAIKQIASRGVPRRKIVLGQYIVLASWMTILTLIAATIRALIVTLYWGVGEGFTVTNLLLVDLGWIAAIWSYSALAVLVAHFVRSSMMSIVLPICLLVGGNMAVLIFCAILNDEKLSDRIYGLWISNVQQKALDYTIPTLHQLGYIGLLCLLGVVCLFLGMYVFEKKDVA